MAPGRRHTGQQPVDLHVVGEQRHHLVGGAGRRHFFFGCQSPSIAPVGSTMIENDP